MLQLVEGLEELFIGLKVRGAVPNRTLWRHVAKHVATLSKYVQHYRSKIAIKPGHASYKTVDLESWGLEEGQDETLQTFLVSLDVESLGLAGSPQFLVSGSSRLSDDAASLFPFHRLSRVNNSYNSGAYSTTACGKADVEVSSHPTNGKRLGQAGLMGCCTRLI